MFEVRFRADASALLTSYAVAIASVFAAGAASTILVETLGDQRGMRAVFYLVPVAIARLYGRWQGVLAAVLSALALDLFFIQPLFTLGPDTGGLLVRMATMLASVALVASRSSTTPANGRRRFWGAESSGDYERDVEEGTHRGERLVRDLRLQGDHYVLGWMVREMVQGGRFGGIEVGFCEAVAKACAGSALLGHDLAQDLDREAGVVETKGPIQSRPVGQHHRRRVELK